MVFRKYFGQTYYQDYYTSYITGGSAAFYSLTAIIKEPLYRNSGNRNFPFSKSSEPGGKQLGGLYKLNVLWG
jgi:hypothetical protein